MKRLSLVLLVLMVAGLACNAGETSSTEEPVGIILTATATLRHSNPLPSSATPDSYATPSGPSFEPSISFATAPMPSLATVTFPAGTKQIFAMWTYHNMQAGMLISREWYLDGELWIKREEPWDFDKYGAEGVIDDISIYDFDAGLPSGFYKLQLYIDGVEQVITDEASRSFTISKSAGQGAITSPDGKHTVAVEPVNRLALQQPSGEWVTLATLHSIEGVVWMPDNRHVAFVDTQDDGTGSPLGKSFDLWMVDIESGQPYELTQGNENLSAPLPSPDGRTIAAYDGTGYGDACGVDSSLVFINLDSAYQRTGLTRGDEFIGYPTAPNSNTYPTSRNTVSQGDPIGVWLSPTTIRVYLQLTCSEVVLDGDYQFDLAANSVSRVGNLPGIP